MQEIASNGRGALLASLSLLPFLLLAESHAASHLDLEEGLPTVIEDAYPIKQGAIEIQGFLRYDRAKPGEERTGRDRFEIMPKLEYGAARNLQVSIASPYRLGDAPETKQGNVRFDALYNFNTEGRSLPAFSVAGGIDQPFGLHRGGTETVLKGIMTKSVGPFGESYIPRRLHVNVAWFHNWDPRPEERRNRYLAGVAYSQPLNNEWVLAADVFREQRRERDSAYNMTHIGLRRQLTPLTVFTMGVGAGLSEEAPRWRVIFGFQHTLGTRPLGM